MQLSLVLGALALAGCGGSAAPKPAVAPPSPDLVAKAFVKAAAAGDYGAALKTRFAPFAAGYKTQVSERVIGPFGVIGIRRGLHAEAIVMKKQNGNWRVSIARSKLLVRVLGPQPGTKPDRVQQVAAAVDGIGSSGIAVVYLDGVTLNPKVAEGRRSATVYANLASPLTAGPHDVVVFASAKNDATARAWTFTVKAG